jgi:hypothetical protein
MPFTPFHGGIGIALKGSLGGRFSFSIFAATQIAIDLESGYFLASGGWPLHRFLHTFIGATNAGLAVALFLRPLCAWAVSLCRTIVGTRAPAWLDLNDRITVGSVLLGCLGLIWMVTVGARGTQ